MYESNGHGHSKISMNGLCSVKTTHLCDTAIRLIDALAAYHLFVETLDDETLDDSPEDTAGHTTTNGITVPPKSVIEMILKRRNVEEYTPEMLRADYHHFREYHVANKQFMKRCYERLMNINEHQDIIDLFDITDKINANKKVGNYFGHRLAEEQEMITVLNELHQDLDHDIDDDLDDDALDEEDSLGPLDMIRKLRVTPQYRMAGTHLQHQESLDLGSLTPVGFHSHNDGQLILPEDEERMVALVNEEEEVFPETATPSMFDSNYSVDGY